MKTSKLLFVSLLLLVSSSVFSAPPPPPSGGPICWPPPCIPVDNGVIFLVCAGLLLGAKKILDLRKKAHTIC